MKKTVRRWVLGTALAAAAAAMPFAFSASFRPAHAAEPAPKTAANPTNAQASATQAPAQGSQQQAAGQEVASADQLKSEAFRALRGGQFARTNELLGRAAALSHDPQVEKMAVWTKAFESQREEFAGERQKQFDKAVSDVKLLETKTKPDYALDMAARAFLLAPDKKEFRNEGWVDALVKECIQRAEQYDKDEQWVKALRLYSDLASIEPSQPLWKDRLKLATRRVRLLFLYTPDSLKKLQEKDAKEREQVDDLLKATTQPAGSPTTKPATRPVVGPDGEESFKVDWRDTLRGVRPDILWDALVDARQNYYRDVSFRDLALGGLNGVKAVVTTKGLEEAFPKLGDAKRKETFLAAIDEWLGRNKDATAATEQITLRDTINKLRATNRETVDLPDEVLVSEFADGAFAELDPFTSMIWPSDMEEFHKTTHGEFSGVGIQIQSDEEGNLKVVSPLEDSPAYKAGIKAGDIITHINGKNAKNITTNQAVKNITGEKGTTVVLTIKSPDGKSKDYSIRRETIHVASIKGWMRKPGGAWDWFLDPDNKIAYLRLKSFTPDTGTELKTAIDQIKNSGGRGLIVDLRYNPGGLLTAAIEVCDKFLGDGVIVSTHPDRDTGNPATVARARKDDDDSDLPLVVLVNQYSASASEIVSGCLKDQKRALIVGERTFGKGSVQMLFPLADRSAQLKLTTSHYYLPLGKCIHREENSTEWGVDPDVTVEMTPEQMRAAIDARDNMDVLRDDPAPAQGKQEKLKDAADKAAEDGKDAAAAPDAKAEKGVKKKDILSSDPQLSAALLLLRLQLAGAQI